MTSYGVSANGYGMNYLLWTFLGKRVKNAELRAHDDQNGRAIGLMMLATVPIHPRVLVLGQRQIFRTQMSDALWNRLTRWSEYPTEANAQELLRISNRSLFWNSVWACAEAQIHGQDTQKHVDQCVKECEDWINDRHSTGDLYLSRAVRRLFGALKEGKEHINGQRIIQDFVPMPTAVLACASAGFFESQEWVTQDKVCAVSPWLRFVFGYCKKLDFNDWTGDEDSVPWSTKEESFLRHGPAITALSEEMARKGRWVSRVLEPYWEAIRRGE